MNRRQFGVAALGAAASSTVAFAQSADEPLRVAVVGHTGRGNYGHGLDTVWKLLDSTKIVAVADPDEAGRTKARAKLDLEPSAGYADYRKMFQAVRPDIVAVCPRHADQHRDIIIAAVESGTQGIYVEKPFVRTPAEADEVIAACKAHNAKLAVAHRNRYHPVLQTIDRLIAEGRIGTLLEIRGRGKEDRRGGGEDLWVLGSHVLNLMAYFGGKPLSCSAVMQQDGDRVTKTDVHEGEEGLGLLAGNELHARYVFDSGTIGYFDSIANVGTREAGFGLQLIGNKGLINIQCDKTPLAHLCPGNPFQSTGQPRRWLPISTAGVDEPESQSELEDQIHNHVIPAKDLVAAMREDRQPVCGMHEAALTVEMICAVFESHRQESRAVTLPLDERKNPLASL